MNYTRRQLQARPVIDLPRNPPDYTGNIGAAEAAHYGGAPYNEPPMEKMMHKAGRGRLLRPQPVGRGSNFRLPERERGNRLPVGDRKNRKGV